MFVTDVVLCVCEISFKSYQLCGCYCKIFRGLSLTFMGHTVERLYIDRRALELSMFVRSNNVWNEC